MGRKTRPEKTPSFERTALNDLTTAETTSDDALWEIADRFLTAAKRRRSRTYNKLKNPFLRDLLMDEDELATPAEKRSKDNDHVESSRTAG